MDKNTKLDHWPKVSLNDAGIRPAGAPDKCFYCRCKIGQDHDKKCVIVCKLVEYAVFVDDKPVGTYTRHDPCFWTESDCNFSKNESIWCSDNALDEISWTDSAAEEKAKTYEDSCTCSLLRFKFVRVIDEGPFVAI